MQYRFDKLAFWHKQIISKDGEEARGGVAGISFWCTVTEAKKRGVKPIQGVESKTISVILQTNDNVAEKIEAGDNIEVDNYNYTVQSVGTVRSMAGIGAREYIISLE